MRSEMASGVFFCFTLGDIEVLEGGLPCIGVSLIHPEGELVRSILVPLYGVLLLFHLLVCFSLCLLPWVSACFLGVLPCWG